VKIQKSRISCFLAVLLFVAPAVAATLTAKIRVGKDPQWVAVNPGTHRLYVANDLDGTVSVIDTTNNALLTNVLVSSGVTYLDVNPTTNLIYVAGSYNSGQVTVINGADNSILTTISVGQGSYGIAVNQMTNRIYAVNNQDSTVSVIDGSTNTVIATAPVGSGPRYVVVDPVANFIYVSDFTTLYAINGQTNLVVNSLTASHDITGLAADPVRQRVYITDDVITMLIGIDTTTFTVSETLGTFESVFAIAVRPVNGDILVCLDSSQTGQAIGVVNPNTFRLVGFIGKGLGRGYTAVVVDPNTGISYASVEPNGVFVFSP
jgi:YVTN family beta-propeller protein